MEQKLKTACEILFLKPYTRAVRHLLYNGTIEPELLDYVENRRICSVLPSTRTAALFLKQYVQQRTDDNKLSYKWGF